MSRKIALFSISLLATCAVAEFALRLVDFRPELSSAWILDSEYRVLDEHLITVDRHYLEDGFYESFQVAAPTRLVVALGDSFTAGIPVSYDDAYPAVLERMLRDDSFDVRVMNAGLGDTGPEQHLVLLTNYILPRVDPDIVIWQFYANDSVDNALKPLFSLSEKGALVPLDARDNWLYRRQ